MKVRNASINDTGVLQGLYEFIKSLEIDLIKKIGEEQFFEILQVCYKSEEDRYSYKNCRVIEMNGEVLGFYFSYEYDFLESSKEYWENIITPKFKLDEEDVIFDYNEAKKGEFYLDILYIIENMRSKGYGRKLLTDFFNKEHKIKSLNVAENNSKAKKLYENFGMKPEGEIEIANHKYYHMVHRG